MDKHGNGLPNLRQLEQFVAVAQELHFGRAAQRLHIHQAPLSQAIQKLEVRLGMQLFERTHRSVALTPAGTILFEQAHALLESARRLSDLAEKLAGGEAGRLTVGFVSTAMYGYLPDVVRVFGERYPEVELRLREATSNVQLRQLELSDLDIGLILGDPTDDVRGISARLVRSDRLVVAVPENWPSAKYARDGDLAELERLQQEPLLTIPREVGPALYDALLACFQSRGLTPRFGQEGIQMQTLLGLTAAGLGYTIVPTSMRMLARPDVRFLEIAGGAPAVELWVAWRTRDPNPLCRNFVQLATAKPGVTTLPDRRIDGSIRPDGW